MESRGSGALIRLIAALLPLLMLAGAVLPASAERAPLYGSGKFEAEWQFGYSSGSLVIGKTVPIYVTLTNRTGRDIEGYVSARLGCSSFYNEDEQLTVEKDFVIPDGVKKRIEIPVTATVQYDTCVCSVRNSGGRLVTAEETKQLNVALNPGGYYGSQPQTAMIGWMTEEDGRAAGNPVNVGSMIPGSGSGWSYGYQKSGCISEHISPDHFPSDMNMMNCFDAIFVGDIDLTASSAFSSKQLKMLDAYLASGGIVIVGTGAKRAAVLNGFSKYFSGTPESALTFEGKKHIVSIYKSYTGASMANSIIDLKNIDVCSLKDESFTAVPGSQGEVYIYQNLKTGLFVTGFSLSDRAFSGTDDAFPFLLSLIAGRGSNYYSRLVGGSAYPSYMTDKSSLRADTKTREPSGAAILVILLVYIGAGLIGSYIFLRRKRKAVLMWAVFPAAALLFAVMISGYGAAVQGGTTGSTLRTVHLTEGSESGAEVSLNSTVFMSRGSKARLSYDTGEQLSFAGSASTLAGGDRTPFLGFRYGSGDSCMSIDGIARGSYVSCSADYTDGSYSPLTVTVEPASADVPISFPTAFDSLAVPEDPDAVIATVNVVNTCGRPLSDVFVVFRNRAYVLGDLPAGGSMSVGVTAGNAGQTPDATAKELIYKLCYERAGYTRFEAMNDPVNYGVTADDEPVFYIQTYYSSQLTRYDSGMSRYGGSMPVRDSDKYMMLKKDPVLYRRAWIISNLPSYINGIYTDGSNIFVCGFDEGEDQVKLKVNGRYPSRNYTQTLVWQKKDPTGAPAGGEVGAWLVKANFAGATHGIVSAGVGEETVISRKGCDEPLIAFYAVDAKQPYTDYAVKLFTQPKEENAPDLYMLTRSGDEWIDLGDLYEESEGGALIKDILSYTVTWDDYYESFLYGYLHAPDIYSGIDSNKGYVFEFRLAYSSAGLSVSLNGGHDKRQNDYDVAPFENICNVPAGEKDSGTLIIAAVWDGAALAEKMDKDGITEISVYGGVEGVEVY
ncbi:MAG: hypothetical protein IJU46_08925 [Clostridia bacterium]|nr:hypothetical protein [Clostridia bacterium]